MRCFLPFVDKLTATIHHLLQIGQALAADCVPLRLPPPTIDPVSDLENARIEKGASIALSPEVVLDWLGTDEFPSTLASYLVRHFHFVLVHDLDTESTSTNMLRALSESALCGVRQLEDPTAEYNVASIELAGTFSQLRFGPANPGDHIIGQSQACRV